MNKIKNFIFSCNNILLIDVLQGIKRYDLEFIF